MIVKVYHNGDDVLIAWKPDGAIPECRGFALLRRRNGTEEEVETWVGFAGEDHKEGEHQPSDVWPIQKYQWTDYMANPGDRVQYRVVPMVGPDRDHLRREMGTASDWTLELTLSPEAAPGIEAYFNRGIVASQWVARRLNTSAPGGMGARLAQVIQTPNDPFRNYLSGPLGAKLFQLLATSNTDDREIYAALFELNDPQLETALAAWGGRAHVVLANGSVKGAGDDENSAARNQLRDKIDLHDRMTAPRALAHNKFLVICDPANQPRYVWTGSQNWTSTGLCGQANNSVLIDNPDLAAAYLDQWHRLQQAGDATPDDLKQSNSQPRDLNVQGTPVRVWFAPTIGQVDLADARQIISGAKQAILFLMFNPGPRDTLLNQILETSQADNTGRPLYVRGALNQDPGTKSNPVQLFDSESSQEVDFDLVLPAAIDAPTTWFVQELLKLPHAFAMIHSKVVVVDPFGDQPVLLTGSHNMGPKASGWNDENLLIIRNAPGLCAAYATNIMGIYNQYRWRYRRHIQPAGERWDGLQDNDTWQQRYLEPGSKALDEINFWVGE